MTNAEGRLVGGRYHLIEPIGRGGMGIVWRAHDELLDRAVAVKEVRYDSAMGDELPELNRRTMREARAAGRLTHPNVVVVHDVIEEDGRPWIIMQLVESRSLGQVIRQDGPLTPKRATEIGLQILDALRAAHAQGVLHRDVKPENVLLADDGRVVLTDFGIARVETDSTMTRTGLVGTPAFIAPERLRGGPAQRESDLWSLGATLYAAVEGRPPHDKGMAMATMHAVLTEPPDPARNAGSLRPVLDRLLEKDPATRPGYDETARLLRRAATEQAAPRPVDASGWPSPPSPQRAGRANGVPKPSAVPPEAFEATDPDLPTTPTKHPRKSGPARPDDAPAESPAGKPSPSTGAEPAGPQTGDAIPAQRPAEAAKPTPKSGAKPGAKPGGTPAKKPVKPATGAKPADKTPADPASAGKAASGAVAAEAVADKTPADAADKPATPGGAAPGKPNGGAKPEVAREAAPAEPEPVREFAQEDGAEARREPAAEPKPAPKPGNRRPPSAPYGGAGVRPGAGRPAETPRPSEPAPARQPSAAPGAFHAEPVGASPFFADEPGHTRHGEQPSVPLPESGRQAWTTVDIPERRNGLLKAALIAIPAILVVGGVALWLGMKQADEGSGTAATLKPPATSVAADPSGEPSEGTGGEESGKPSATPSEDEEKDPSPEPSESASKDDDEEDDADALPKGWKMHTNSVGFSLALPPGWKQVRSDSGNVWFEGPLDGAYLQIGHTSSPGKDALADWKYQEANSARYSFSGYKRISMKKVDYFRNAADWEWTFEPGGFKGHILNRGFVVDDKHGYAILWKTRDKDWDKYRHYFDNFAKSFEPAK
ncbi:serine/threonine-protein kinase [Herbidospora yilanensis]|uniref:serine/threonine-protein kinase n=1 Tax=Herbidospora yilanensis TaxID=354426 RepID=UPI000785D287|nr:serine/threonine-protein kinase [Herbidospora yilanensis]